MRAPQLLLAVSALLGSLGYSAAGQDCRFVVSADHRLVSVRQDGTATATFANGEQGHWTAAWSPDGRQVLYSAAPSEHGDPVDIHLAGADGTELGVLRVTAAEPRNYDIEGITEIHWLDETGFWYVARVGHQGAYVDVWHIGPQFARSELEARLGVAGGPCSLAPNLKLLACVAEDHLANQWGINVFDYRSAISGEPPPEVGTLEDAAYSAIANRSGKADRDARVEGGLHWSGAGQVVFALRQAERLELGTLDRPQAPTKSWILTLRPVSGVEGRVKTIRESGVGYEIVTEKGAFVVGDEADNASPRRSAATLAAKKLRPQEPLTPPGMTEFSVLDRWCRDGRHTHD